MNKHKQSHKLGERTHNPPLKSWRAGSRPDTIIFIKNRTVPIFIFVFLLVFTSSVFAATAIKTVEYFVGQGTTQIETGTTSAYPVNVYIAENPITVRTAYLEVRFQEGANNVTSCTVTVNIGGNTYTYKCSATVTNSGDNIYYTMRFNVTDAFSGVLSAGSNNCNIGVNVSQPRDNQSVKLYLTYEYDDASSTQLKTIRFFVGSRNTIMATNNTQTFSHTPYIPETSAAIKSAWYEIRGHSYFYTNTATIGLNGVEANTQANVVLLRTYNGSGDEFLYFYKPDPTTLNIGSSNILTIGIVSGSAAAGWSRCLSAELVITYSFDYSASNTLTNTIRQYLGQTDVVTTDVENTVTYTQPIYFPENPFSPTIRSIYAVVRTTNSATVIDLGLGQGGANTLAFAVQGNYVVAGPTILYDLSPTYGSANNTTNIIVGASWSLLGGGSRSVELIYTYEYPKTATRRQKTVYYGAATGGTIQDAIADTGSRNFQTNIYIPETNMETITYACAFAKTTVVTGAGTDKRFKISVGGSEDIITMDYDGEALFGEYVRDVTNLISGPGQYNIGVNLTSLTDVDQSHFSSAITYVTYKTVTADETASCIAFTPYEVPADGTSRCTAVVTIKDNWGFPIAGKVVNITTTRAGMGQATINDNAGGTSLSQTTNINGVCTWTIKSNYAGQDTITATCDGKIIARGVNKDGAVGIWEFDTDTLDYSGYGNNGTIGNDPVWVTGKFGSALDFGGPDDTDYVFVSGSSSSLENVTDGSYSFEAWAKPMSIPPGTTPPGPYTIIGRIGQHTDIQYRSDKKFALETWNTVPNWYGAVSASTYEIGSWYHVVGVLDNSAKKVYIYVNGSLDGSADFVGDPSDYGTANYYIGCAQPDNATYPYWFHGTIDDVRIYNRALSADEIKASYNKKANIYFFANKLKITTPAITTTVNNPSAYIRVEVQDGAGNRDTSFDNTVTLSSSSSGGKFSVARGDWQDTTIITLSQGSAIVYYKDSNTGNPIITAYRESLTSDTQVETILAQGVNETASYITFTPYQIMADGTSVCTAVITINDTYGYPIVNKLTTLQTTNGNSDTIQDSLGGSVNPQTTNVNGQCTWTIKSGYVGWDTITARCDGNTITRGVNKYGAVGIWHFDTDTKDVSGYGNNGTLSSNTGPLWTSAPDSAAQGCALQFDGVSDYVQVPANSSLDSPSFTIMFWLKPEQLRIQGLIDKSNFGTSWRFFMEDASGHIELDYNDGAPAGNLITGSTASVGNWFHITGTFDFATRVAKLYFNAGVEATSTGGSWGNTVSTPIVIAPVALNRFNGIIDEVQIYNRALSDAEIKASYNKRANIYFTGNKLKITTPAITTTVNNPSFYIRVEVQDGAGNRDTSFDNTVTFSSSSSGGKFSVDRVTWQDTSIITLSAGFCAFYYKDSAFGNPTITVSRAGLDPAVQTENVLASLVFNETTSYISFTPYAQKSSGIDSVAIFVTIADAYGYPISGKSVTLQTARGANTTTISANPQTTDINGKCTFTISSAVFGTETITATCDGKTITRGVDRYGVVGLWYFDTDTSDYSGYGNNGTAYNNPLWVAGKFGSCLQFDGLNNYVNVPYNPSLAITGNMTVEAWINAQTFGNWVRIVGKSAYPGFKYTLLTGDNNNIGFILNIGGSEKAAYSGASTLPVGQWAYVAGTFDGSYVRMYINGQEVASTPASGNIDSDTGVLRIGQDPCGSSTFNGLIDGVKVYNRALGADEIKASYNSSCNVKFVAPATKLKITSLPQTIGAGVASELFTVESRDASDSKDITFNDTVALKSSSSTGRFSSDKTNWSITNEGYLYFVAGESKFYYSDGAVGAPVITVSRTGLTSDTQVVTITPTSIWETNCYFTANKVLIPADGSSTCSITIVIKDISGNILGGKQVTIYSVRSDSDVIIQPGVTSPNGQCTGSISSTYPGGDTIYAICEGKTIGENLIPNGSFEIGSNADAYNWSEGSQGVRSSTYAHSGNWAMRVQADSNPVSIDNSTISVISGSKYKFSAWFYVSSHIAGSWPFLDLNDVVGDPEIYSNQEGVWHYVENTWSDSGYSSVNPRIACHSGTIATAWIDDVRLWKIPTIEFTPVATRFVITSSPFIITQNNPASVTVQAQDNYGNKATSFNETVSLASSSSGGKFSLSSGSWVDTTIINLSSGEITFYYKDSTTGYPTITVSRTGLTSATQSETIITAVANTDNSFIFVSVSSAKANLTDTISVGVTMKDDYGYPIASKSVTLSSVRGTTQVSSNPQTTDANGQCTFTISSQYAGQDTITATCDGKTITRGINKDGAVGIWEFDANTLDYSGYGNNGTIGNDPVWVTGKFGSALDFGGPDDTDYVFVSGSSSSLENATDGSYSFEAWAKPMSVPPGPTPPGPYTIIGRIGEHTDIQYRSDIRFAFSTWNTVSNAYVALSAATYDPGSWYHIVGVLDISAMKVYIYVNGSLGGSADFVGTPKDYGTNPYYIGCAQQDNVTWPFWFHGTIDAVRIYNRALSADEIKASYEKRVNIYFTATKLGFGQSAFKLKAGTSSSALTANAQGNIGGVDMTLNTAVILATSSNSGVFSANGSSWGNYGESRTLNLVDGETTFYYRDYKVGNPVLTISYPYTELNTSTQIETITAPFIRFTSSPFTISVTDTSSKIIMNAQGYSGETDTNFSETAVFSSTSPRGKFSISNTAWSDTTIVKFSSGSAAFYYRDKRAGNPALTVSNSELGLSDNQTETVTAPIITITKTQQNIRTGITGTLLAAVSGDTVEYAITIINNGQESATGIIVADTVAFDTNIYSPMVFVSMDTAPNADSWTYTTGTVWQVWGNVPSPGDENIKGLKWKINSIAAGQNKQLKFRLRVK